MRELEKLGSTNPGVDTARRPWRRRRETPPTTIGSGWDGPPGDAGGPARRGEAAARPVPRAGPPTPPSGGRLSWAKAAEDAGEIERAVRHLPPDRVGPAEILTCGPGSPPAPATRIASGKRTRTLPASRQPEDPWIAWPPCAGSRPSRRGRPPAPRQAALTDQDQVPVSGCPEPERTRPSPRRRGWPRNWGGTSRPGVDAGRPGRPERSCRPRGRGPAEGGGSPAPCLP